MEGWDRYMGDGKKLREILDEQGKSVRWLARETNINSSTLFSIIRKDTFIRYDFAIKIANALNIDASSICSDEEFFEESWNDENQIELPRTREISDVVFDNKCKRYIKNTLYPLMSLYGKESMQKVDDLIKHYYLLNDEGRKNVDSYINYLLAIQKDDERERNMKELEQWK